MEKSDTCPRFSGDKRYSSGCEVVLSAMSGGVDSSVATLLLVESGYEVKGVTMKLFGNELVGKGHDSRCCSLDDVLDAREICASLGILHYTLNGERSFRAGVIDRFCEAYLSGATPNPCIDCNRYVKFAWLQERRRAMGADYVATGHYARRCWDPKTGFYRLLRARDMHKVQSYELYRITQEQLAHMLFPLGDLTKTEVRHLAEAHGFGNAHKRDSQDICFVPEGDYATFIERTAPEEAAALFEPGPIVTRDGTVLGTHRGLVRYTIGQRKGIGIASPRPLYVLSKDISQNALVVAERDELFVDAIEVEDVNVISGNEKPRTLHAEVKTGYRQRPVQAQVELLSDARAAIHFATPQVRPAPGQSAVIYQGDELIGGGIIL